MTQPTARLFKDREGLSFEDLQARTDAKLHRKDG